MSSSVKKKVLVTGSSGFIGSHLISKFNHLGYEVIKVSRSRKTASHVIKNISGDTEWSDILEDVEVIVHCAAAVHQMNLSENTLNSYQQLNIEGTINFASKAAKAGVKRFIFISSIKVNGEKTPIGRPFLFDDPRRAEDPYGISKAKAEEGLEEIASKTNLEVTIIRPPLVYGPDVRANFASLLKLASKNFPLPFGAINNKRSFVALDNLVDLIITCIDHPNAANQTFLVSDDNDVSTSELYSVMVESFGKKAMLININPYFLRLLAQLFGKKEMIERLCGDLRIDISHTKNTLDWMPVVSLAEGVKKCASSLISNK